MTSESEGPTDIAAAWRVIGRIEGDIASLREGQADIRADLREVNRRVDRLFYTLLAVGGALFVAIFVSRLIGN